MFSCVLHFPKVRKVAIFVARSPHKKQAGKGKEKEREKYKDGHFVQILL